MALMDWILEALRTGKRLDVEFKDQQGNTWILSMDKKAEEEN